MAPPGPFPGHAPVPGHPPSNPLHGARWDAPAPRPAVPTAPHAYPQIGTLGSPSVPGMPGSYPPPPSQTLAAPKPRSNRSILTIFCLFLVLIVGGTLGATAFMLDGGQVATLGQPEEEISPSPEDGDPPQVRNEYLKQQVGMVLRDSAQGLLDGDQDRWLAAFDPRLHEDAMLRFESLRAMSVSAFEYRVISSPIDTDPGFVQFRLAASYCFGGGGFDTCQPSSIIFETEWTDTAPDFTMTRMDLSTEAGPRPWEIDKLEARVGERAIVAAPLKYADQLDEALAVAEAAAENADQWAAFEPVDKYIVYLAGNDEFESWYGMTGGMENVVGFAIPLPLVDENNNQKVGGSEVVMHVDRIRDTIDFTSTMRHELGHVATLHHGTPLVYQEERWWIAEGSAELIDHGVDTPIDTYLRKRDVEEFIDTGGWNDGFAPVADDADVLEGSGKYGIAFYGAYYLVDEYGKDPFLEFLGLVCREGKPADEAAQTAFGKSYAEIEGEMTDFVMSVAG